jgi:hypothetical protein
VSASAFDHGSGFGERVEGFTVEQLIPWTGAPATSDKPRAHLKNPGAIPGSCCGWRRASKVLVISWIDQIDY